MKWFSIIEKVIWQSVINILFCLTSMWSSPTAWCWHIQRNRKCAICSLKTESLILWYVLNKVYVEHKLYYVPSKLKRNRYETSCDFFMFGVASSWFVWGRYICLINDTQFICAAWRHVKHRASIKLFWHMIYVQFGERSKWMQNNQDWRVFRIQTQ